MQAMIASLFSGTSKEVVTFFLAMIPAIELKASIPIAILRFNLSPQVAFMCSVLGSLLMGVLIFVLFRFLFKTLLNKMKFINKAQKNRYGKKYKIGEGMLIIFLIAVPLPGFGSFLGAIVASLLQTKINRMMIYLVCGNFLAGGIVLAAIMGLKL